MDVQKIAGILAEYRARREQLLRVELSGMATPWEERERAYDLKYDLKQVDNVIAMAEELLERVARRAARTTSGGAREQEHLVVAAQTPVEARPFFHVDDTECYLPDVDEALIAAFEEGNEH
jgi:hypothetical protein